MQSNTGISENKICSQCGENKFFSDFYEREKGVRWDALCIECRKIARRNQYAKRKNFVSKNETKNIKKSNESLPDSMIERETIMMNDDLLPNKCYNKMNDSSDFQNWKNSYKQELTEKDRLEITNSVIGFTFLLADELNNSTGAYVDLSKENK